MSYNNINIFHISVCLCLRPCARCILHFQHDQFIFFNTLVMLKIVALKVDYFIQQRRGGGRVSTLLASLGLNYVIVYNRLSMHTQLHNTNANVLQLCQTCNCPICICYIRNSITRNRCSCTISYLYYILYSIAEHQ